MSNGEDVCYHKKSRPLEIHNTVYVREIAWLSQPFDPTYLFYLYVEHTTTKTKYLTQLCGTFV